MSDFVLRKRDGWVELDDVDEAIDEGDLDVDALWEAVGEDDMRGVKRVLAKAFDLKKGEPVEEVRVIAEPDEEGGDHVRIWVK